MIKRTNLTNSINTALNRSRIVALTGPRQCGKTTLAREFVPDDSPNYFDLEDPVSLTRLDEPMTALRGLAGLVVIDEIQRRPDLFQVLRVLADKKPLAAKFLILGSASPDLIRHSSETLAGRVETIAMSGFSLAEIGCDHMKRHWVQGGFPLSFLAKSETDSIAWRKQFIMTFIERDLLQWGISAPSVTLLRFWTMLAHYHGQIWNASEPARALGISEPTVRKYLDILTGVFMVRQLQPWHANLKKRQVKAPKIYFRDTGLLHYLLGIGNESHLLSHPKCGASWEGYIMEQVQTALNPDEIYFWATHNGAEIDLVMVKNNRLYGVECKRTDAPHITPSMRIALDDLGLERISVIYPGDKTYALNERIDVLPVSTVMDGTLADKLSGGKAF